MRRAILAPLAQGPQQLPMLLRSHLPSIALYVHIYLWYHIPQIHLDMSFVRDYCYGYGFNYASARVTIRCYDLSACTPPVPFASSFSVYLLRLAFSREAGFGIERSGLS